QIVRGVGSCARLGGGKCFDDDVRRMTNDLWRLARRGMTPSATVRDDEDQDAEFKWMTRAAIVIQRCSRRYQAREPRKTATSPPSSLALGPTTSEPSATIDEAAAGKG
ncbi:unnamed protein product, partial [Ectocarpus sp. 12 AP-2014]